MLADTIEDGAYTIEVHYDEDAENPRKRKGLANVGIMLCSDSGYDLGDKKHASRDVIRWIMGREDVIYLPLYLHVHTGITLRTSPFSQWDSEIGKVGIIYMTKARALAVAGWKRFTATVTATVKAEALRCLETEIKIYNAYLQGNTFRYVVKNPVGKILDSCYGFYETSNEDRAYMLSEAKDVIQHDREKRAKARAQRRANSAERRILDTGA